MPKNNGRGEDRNCNRVARRQWAKWSKRARLVFNRTYDFFINNQKLVCHPKMPKVRIEHWLTIAWNAAWIAADACDDTIPDEVVDV